MKKNPVFIAEIKDLPRTVLVRAGNIAAARNTIIGDAITIRRATQDDLLENIGKVPMLEQKAPEQGALPGLDADDTEADRIAGESTDADGSVGAHPSPGVDANRAPVGGASLNDTVDAFEKFAAASGQ
jgi:hypothetical protein